MRPLARVNTTRLQSLAAVLYWGRGDDLWKLSVSRLFLNQISAVPSALCALGTTIPAALWLPWPCALSHTHVAAAFGACQQHLVLADARSQPGRNRCFCLS